MIVDIKESIKSIRCRYLPLLPIILLGSLSNLPNQSLTVNQDTHTHTHLDNTYPLFLPLLPDHYTKTLTDHVDTIKLQKVYDQTKSEKSLFTFPNKKSYKLTSHTYRLDHFRNHCYYISNGYRDVCTPTAVHHHDDQLITYKPRIFINSLKGFDLSEDHTVKYYPDHLDYDDWSLRSIIRKESNRVNWKQQYSFFKKNIFENTIIQFNNKDLSPFSSSKYTLNVERDVAHGTNIPVFTGFHKGRDDMKHTLGFDSYDEINIPLDKMLERNNLQTLPVETLNHYKNINFSNHTVYNYGWYNYFWSPYYQSYDNAQVIVERMKTGIVDNFGSPYLSWSIGNYWDNRVYLHIPVPFSDKYEPFTLTPTGTDEYANQITNWDNDLFHVNYDNVVKFSTPYISDQYMYYPFYLDLNKINSLTNDLQSFFRISEHFNFYIHYTYKGEDRKSPGFRISDLIKPNTIMIRSDSSDDNSMISDVYLSIEPIDKDRVQLINPGYGQWEYSVSVGDSRYYSLNKDSSDLDTINVSKLSKVTFNDKLLKNLLPSQTLHYDYLSQLFKDDDHNNKRLSSNQIQSILQPISVADDFNGTLKLSYNDPSSNKRITKYFSNMIRLDNYPNVLSSLDNDDNKSSRIKRHSSSISLSTNNITPDYLLNNDYWNNHVRLIPVNKDTNGFPISYKVDIVGMNLYPKIKKQWSDMYTGKVFSSNSSFSVAPVQKQRYTLNNPDYYLNNTSAIWGELIHHNPLAKAVNINQNDFTVSVLKDDDKSLIVNVSLNAKSKSYSFTYDKTKIVNGMIDDPNNPYVYHPPKKPDWSSYFSNLQSNSSMTETTKILLSILVCLLVGVCIGYFGYKLIKTKTLN